MNVQTLLNQLEIIAPNALSEKWDNCGLLIGNPQAEIDYIALALEVDQMVIDATPENSALIVHHPLIFSGIKSIRYDQYPGVYIQKCMAKNIQLIALHTNADCAFLGEYVAKEILQLEIIKQEGYILELAVDKTFDECTQFLKNTLALEQIRTVKSANFIKTATLITGSGASYISEITTDCLFTGDVKYHDAVHAQALRKSVFDLGHFESEHWFNDALSLALKQQIALNAEFNFDPENILKLQSQNPFMVF